ncbi:hypothetical protein NC652_040750 [Populus alba x Populus x berolinensis]|nr:hypothetical protein NC652_040750 [Populus alba x Populus x berolinensis]
MRTSPLTCCLSDIFLLPASSVLASFSGLVTAPHICLCRVSCIFLMISYSGL